MRIKNKVFSFFKKKSLLESFILGGGAALISFPIPGSQLLLLLVIPRLLLNLEHSTLKRIFLHLFMFFWGYFSVALYWMSHALFVEFETFFWYIPFCLLGVPAFMSGIAALTFFLVPWWRFQDYLRILLFAAAWVLSEIALSFIFTGFPWALIGYTWMKVLEVAQFGSVFGVYGLSLLTILWASIPYLYFTKHKSKRRMLFLILGGASFLGVVGYGIHRLKVPSSFTSVSLRLVQPNISQARKLDVLQQFNSLEQLIQLSQAPWTSPPHLIIWPEAAVEFNIETSPEMRARLVKFLPENSFLITGGVRENWVNNQAWNSIFVIDASSQIVASYNKNHLVPFGEYIPLRQELERILPTTSLKKITSGILDFSEGEGLKPIKLPEIPAFSPLICYEIIFPGFVLPQNSSSVQWLLNLSNDGWFGESVGPYQHFQISRMRAIEEGIPLVRVGNTGNSAVVDPYGRILKSLPLNTAGVIDINLPVSLPTKTFFSHYCKNLSWVIYDFLRIPVLIGIALFFCILSSIKRKLRKKT